MKSPFAKTIVCLLIAFSMLFSTSCNKEGNNNEQNDDKKVYYNVVFDCNGGTEISPQRVEKGKTASKPTNPTKKDSTFADWYRLGEPYDFSTPVTENISLTAKWYNSNIKYRVTVGVDGYLGDRGSAVIEGQSVSSVNFSEGQTVTLTATANEGFSFVAWVDYYSGELVSQSATHTFIVTEEVTLEATFTRVVSGLDNPANQALWNALSAMDELNSASFTASVITEGDGVEKNDLYELSFNKQEGVMILTTPYGKDMAVVEGEVVSYYTYDGEEFVVSQTPNMIIASLTSAILVEEADAENTEQTLLAIYQMLKDSVSLSEDGLNVSVDLKPTLEEIRAFVVENSTTTIKKYLYGVIEPEFDKLINGSFLPVEGLFDELSVEELISMLTAEGVPSVGAGEDVIKELDAIVEDMIDGLSEELALEGFTFDKSEALSLYEELMSGSVIDAFEMLNDGSSTGDSSDVPERASLSLAVFYAVYNNFTIEETAKTIVNCLYLNGTQYDFTAENNTFDGATIVGDVIIENGRISFAELGLEVDGGSVSAKVSFSFTNGWSNNN